jgi:hypothetical protein
MLADEELGPGVLNSVASAAGSGRHRISLEVVYPRQTDPRLPVGAARFRLPCDGRVGVWLGLVGSLAVLGCLGTYQRIHIQIYDLGAPSLRNRAVIITGALSISS